VERGESRGKEGGGGGGTRFSSTHAAPRWGKASPQNTYYFSLFDFLFIKKTCELFLVFFLFF
jgi:hypothetical protein